ncbi:hypothetical protein LINPERHAP2_LOCUS19278 [Linum perenne]
MSRKLPQLWSKKGGVQVSDVGFGFYVVNFETVADYERALFGGPWMTILKHIGDRIGKTVRIDNTTLEGSRGNFARICVEVDLSKPLLSKYRMRRRVRRIEYEGLHTICFNCGCYGHKGDACKQEPEAEAEVTDFQPNIFANPIFQGASAPEVHPEVEEDFGPRMQVKKIRRKPPTAGSAATRSPKDPTLVKVTPVAPEVDNSNRFFIFGKADIQGDSKEQDQGEIAVPLEASFTENQKESVKEGDKENVDPIFADPSPFQCGPVRGPIMWSRKSAHPPRCRKCQSRQLEPISAKGEKLARPSLWV